MKRDAFGAIDLLIGLVLTTIVFLIGMNAFKGTSSINLNGSSVDTRSVKEQVDTQVNEIENMRQQTITNEFLSRAFCSFVSCPFLVFGYAFNLIVPFSFIW